MSEAKFDRSQFEEDIQALMDGTGLLFNTLKFPVLKDLTKNLLKDEKEDYYTSRRFNIFEVVEHLSKYPDWKAKRNGKTYKVTEGGKLVQNNEPMTPVEVSKETLNWLFELVKPEPKEEWIDCDDQTAIQLIMNGKTKKIRSLDKDGNIINTYNRDNFDFRNVPREELGINSKWQYLKG